MNIRKITAAILAVTMSFGGIAVFNSNEKNEGAYLTAAAEDSYPAFVSVRVSEDKDYKPGDEIEFVFYLKQYSAIKWLQLDIIADAEISGVIELGGFLTGFFPDSESALGIAAHFSDDRDGVIGEVFMGSGESMNLVDGELPIFAIRTKIKENAVSGSYSLPFTAYDCDPHAPEILDMDISNTNFRVVSSISSNQGLKGDVNGDGKVNVSDVLLIASYVKSGADLGTGAPEAADVNGDGKINVSDILAAAKQIKGTPYSAPSVPGFSQQSEEPEITTGWQTEKSFMGTEGTYYYNDLGEKVKGYQTIDGNLYYFNDDGRLLKLTKVDDYIIDINGVCHAMPAKTGNNQLDANNIADLLARCVGSGTDLERVSQATFLVSRFCKAENYTTSGYNYYQGYSLFTIGEFSCEGATRSLGMVLDRLGYSWEHVNPHQWTHQWCRLYMDGQLGFADASFIADKQTNGVEDYVDFTAKSFNSIYTNYGKYTMWEN